MKTLRRKITEDPFLGLLLVAPLLIWVLITLIYPLLYASQLGFYNVRYVGVPARFIGVSNYSRILGDPDFWKACLRSLIWTVCNVAFQVLGSLLVALVLNQQFRGRTIIRNWIILPWVLPTVVLAIMWTWILDPTHGVVNYLLKSGGLVPSPLRFLSSSQWVMPTVIFINVWRWTPYFAIIVLAALQTIPKELMEAALVDGASTLRRFWHITLPTIKPVLSVVTLISFLWSINIFDTIWLLTRGGPLDFTTTLPIYIYKRAFQDFRFSEAAAMSVIMFLFLLGFAVAYLRTLFREGAEG
jgi:multiple sugar transport system permease protein